MVQDVIPERIPVPTEKPFVINLFPVGPKLQPFLRPGGVGFLSAVTPSEFFGDGIYADVRAVIDVGIYPGIHLDLITKVDGGDVAQHPTWEGIQRAANFPDGARVNVPVRKRVNDKSDIGHSANPTF